MNTEINVADLPLKNRQNIQSSRDHSALIWFNIRHLRRRGHTERADALYDMWSVCLKMKLPRIKPHELKLR